MKRPFLAFEPARTGWLPVLTGRRPLVARPWQWVILATAAASFTLSIVQATQARQQLAAAREELQSVQQAQRRPSAARDGASTLTAAQAAAWNQIARQLNIPWAQLLDALENATPPDIALVAIEPDARRASIRLQAEARALEPLLAYPGALRASGLFDDAVLVKHETNEQDGAKPMRLSLDVRFKAEAPR